MKNKFGLGICSLLTSLMCSVSVLQPCIAAGESVVNVKVDFSALCNTRIETGYALTNHGIDVAKFKAENTKWQWKEEWTAGKNDNVMLLGENEYYVKNIMPDGLALFRTYNGKNSLHNIDIEDGFYQSVSFLTGNWGASKLAVKFNYKDGSSSYYTEPVFPWTGADSIQAGYQQIVFDTVSSSGTAGTRRFTELVFDNIDSSRILTSIDVLPGHWDIDEFGNVIQQENVPANRQCDLYILGINMKTTSYLQKAYEDLKPISVKTNINNVCNTAIDASVLATHKLNLAEFKKGGDNWKWKDEWVNNDNTIIFRDREYYVKNITEDGIALLRTFQNGVSAPFNIPVEENIYSEVGFLAAANAGSNAYLQLAVRFNYSDNTNSGFIARQVISSVSIDPSSPAVKMVSVNGGGGAGTRYFTDYTFDEVDSTKVLTSIDILPADWEIKPDGTAAKSGNTSSRTYDVYVMGICPMTTKDNIRTNVENKIENLSDELTDADKPELNDIYEKINTLLNYDVPESKIKGIEKFRELYGRYPAVKSVSVTNDFENVYMQVEFNTDVNVNQEDFTVMDSAQKNIKCSAVYENNKAIITFANMFDYTGSFTLLAARNISNSSYPALTLIEDYQYKFLIHDILSVNEFTAWREDDTVTANVKINNNLPKNIPSAITIAFFDGNGKMFASKLIRSDLIPLVDNEFNFTYIIPKHITLNGDIYAKVFVLDSYNGLKRIYKSSEKKF